MFVDEVKYFSLKHAWKKTLFNILVTRVFLTVCFYDVTCAFKSEPTLYSCLNVKKFFAGNRRGISLSIWLRLKWLWVGIPLQSLGFIFDHIFGPKKDNLFCAALVPNRGMSNGICDLILYLKNEGLNMSWIFRYSSILVLVVFYSVSTSST